MNITRDIYEDLLEQLGSKKALILLGARQVGKTFLLEELSKHCQKKKKRVQYFNLELPDHSRFFGKDYLELYKELTDGIDYLFIDEFQYFKNASKLFKAIFDDKRIQTKVIASGSSSLEMHKHLKESLAARKITRIIRPLNFSEFKQSNKGLTEFLQYGSNPGLINEKTADSKIELLKEILQTYIMKDVKSLIKEENISAFNNLLYHLANSQGQVISTSSLANELRVSSATVESYLNILEQTYIIYSLPSYAKNLSNELKKSKKYYLYDLGIRNAIINNFETVKNRNDKGCIYETFICHYLINKCPANGELRFWRTRNQEEIDFVFLKNQKPYIFEVKSKLNSAEIPSSMKTFIKNYQQLGAAYIVNENIEEEVYFNDFPVRFIKFENLESDLDLKEIFLN